MAHYVIGDVQGCYTVLCDLLRVIDFNFGKDTLWLAGDIVNRGPESLETLRFVRAHEDCVQMVLGNHDLYLLYLSTRDFISYKKKDSIESIIKSKDAKELIDWLRKQPLYLHNDKHIVVHAGVFPDWSFETMRQYGDEIADWLKSDYYIELLDNMYGDLPNKYSDNLKGFDRLRFNINVFTRMRALYRKDKRLEFKFKSGLSSLPSYLVPWFYFDNNYLADKKILFGHWSMIGLHDSGSALCLDTGAVWGGRLTAYNLDTQEVHSVLNYGI